MYYEISEISTEKQTGHCYALVNFWADKAAHDALAPPVLTNDFLMQLRATARVIVTDARGNLKRADGAFIAPEDVTDEDERIGFERETVDVDNRAQIIGNIEAYWDRAVARQETGDRTQRQLQRDESDPHGVLAKADVRALRGAKRERAEAGPVRGR